MINQYNKKLNIGMVEIHIVDHCNLKCKGCSHFSNISNEYYISPDEFETSFKLLISRFDFKVIGFIGGEPLLHPDLNKLITTVNKYYPQAIILITTNATLIPSLSEEQLDFFEQNNVKFTVSKYPANSEYFLKVLDILGDRDLLFNIFIRNYFRKYINIKGDSDITKTYNKCIMKHCIIYKDTRIYHCPFALYVENFNKKFNKNIPVEQGIDIIKTNNEEIKKYLSEPILTCKWCAFDNNNTKFKWDLCYGDAKAEDWIYND